MKYTEFNHRPYEIHMMVYELIKPGSSVLDLGCATGYFAKELAKKTCRVVGVDSDREALKVAKRFCDRVYHADFERISTLPVRNMSYDYIVMLDVIEHLQNREQLLRYLRKWLKPGGFLILSTPNVAHLSIRMSLLFGSFNYTKWGILDETHVHFFTRSTIESLLKKTGWNCKEVYASTDFGQVPVMGKILRYIPKKIQRYVTRIAPELLGVQWLTISKST